MTPEVDAADLSEVGAEAGTLDRFQREGEYWTVSYDGSVVRLKDSKGLRQIARLLAQPGQELHVTDLEAIVSGPAEPAASGAGSRVGHGELALRPDGGDAGELLDAEARAAYKARLGELQEEIDEAEAFNDPVRAEKARDERVANRELRHHAVAGTVQRAARDAPEAADMLIQISIEQTEPLLTGVASSNGKGPVTFVGWLELLRAVAELVSAAGQPGGRCRASDEKSAQQTEGDLHPS